MTHPNSTQPLPRPQRPQQTLSRATQADGIGVHSGTPVRLRLEPAEINTGIVFVREDLPGRPEIAARPENIDFKMLQRMTALQSGTESDAPRVMMIEHLIAACVGLGVTNLRVILDSPECPIFDGSGAIYASMMLEAGLASQSANIEPLRLARPITLMRENAEIIAIPAEETRYTFFAEFRHAGMDDQQVTFELFQDDFASEIAPARTFCFHEDVEKLRAAGLIKGGSLDCAIVLKDGEPFETQYRLENELARHKLLDLMGDLGVLGAPLAALIFARASGHAMHQEFVRILASELL